MKTFSNLIIINYLTNLQILPKSKLFCWVLGTICTVVTVLPASAAERIYFTYGPLIWSVSVKSLDNFVRSGEIDRELGFFLNRLQPEQQTKLRDFMENNYKIQPLVLNRVTHSITGERLLKYIGSLVKM